jgi:tryptophan 2,3-dioxygenase
MNSVHYSDYLQLDKILGAQLRESERLDQPAHDEMLFITIHQAYELWFKQILFEVDSVTAIMKKPAVNDNSPELQTVVHRLSRVVGILKVLVHQIDVMETMTAMDFLDFRDLLRPASGFQSWQFKALEGKLGLQFKSRHGQEYYLSQLKPHEVDYIRAAEKEQTLLSLINSWLERMPFFDEPLNWQQYVMNTKDDQSFRELPPFWRDYRAIYLAGLAPAEQKNEQLFDQVFIKPEGDERSLSPAASRAALFIMLYRGYPILQLPFQLLNNLLEIDEQLSTWRYRHINMVQRIIGIRMGTGGSTGRDYLRGALEKHYIFTEIAHLTSFLIERRKLPRLSPEMEKRLGFLF